MLGSCISVDMCYIVRNKCGNTNIIPSIREYNVSICSVNYITKCHGFIEGLRFSSRFYWLALFIPSYGTKPVYLQGFSNLQCTRPAFNSVSKVFLKI